ncbi:DKNYY domain-containing protein [bacterium]|nr:DKNYY domain-containing protein [bacterium]
MNKKISKSILILIIVSIIFIGIVYYSYWRSDFINLDRCILPAEYADSGKYTRNLFSVYYVPWHNRVSLKGSDPFSFEIIDCSWGKDKNNVYRGRFKLEGADPNTFEIINDQFSKDKNHVYKKHEVVEGADPKTFDYNK